MTITELAQEKLKLCIAIKALSYGDRLTLKKDGKEVCTISYSKWFQSADWGVLFTEKNDGLIFHYNVIDIPFDSFKKGEAK